MLRSIAEDHDSLS